MTGARTFTNLYRTKWAKANTAIYTISAHLIRFISPTIWKWRNSIISTGRWPSLPRWEGSWACFWGSLSSACLRLSSAGQRQPGASLVRRRLKVWLEDVWCLFWNCTTKGGFLKIVSIGVPTYACTKTGFNANVDPLETGLCSGIGRNADWDIL